MKITKKLLQDLIKEELNLLEGYMPKYFGRHKDKYVPTDIFIYSPNATFDYGMQQEWDQPFHEGRTHYFDLTDKGDFKAFMIPHDPSWLHVSKKKLGVFAQCIVSQ